MNEYIPYGKQSISETDIAKVCEVLRSDWLTQGPTVGIFENAVTEKCNAQYAVAVNSATSALHIACLALGLGEGDCALTRVPHLPHLLAVMFGRGLLNVFIVLLPQFSQLGSRP